MKKLALSMAVILMAAPCRADVLKGGVEQIEVLPRINLQAMKPTVDRSGPQFKQNCICFDPEKVRTEYDGGRYRLADGERWILDFGARGEAAGEAVKTLKHYKFTELCTVGPSADGKAPNMQYFTIGGSSTAEHLPGEDAVEFNPKTVEAKFVAERWKVVDGDHWMLDFGNSEADAKKAADILKYYSFRRMCFVGRPGAPMMYFTR